MSIDTHRRTLLIVAGALGLRSVGALAIAQSDKNPKERLIKVIVKKFVFVPNEIRVKQGETVVLQFTPMRLP